MRSNGTRRCRTNNGSGRLTIVLLAALLVGGTFTARAQTPGDLIYAWDKERYQSLTAPVGVIAIVGGYGLAIRNDGTVWAGKSASSQFDRMPGLTGIVAVDGMRGALKSDGSVWTWGPNSSGQLGDGTTTDRLAPAPVPGLTDVIAISASDAYGFVRTHMALKRDGTVWMWGDNYWGQLGIGTKTQSTTPIQVPGLANVTAICCSGSSSYAVKADDTVWAWGGGPLGDGNTGGALSPVPVPGLSGVGVRAIFGGQFALKADGTVLAWGSNFYGQLGTGAGGSSCLTPVPGLLLPGGAALGNIIDIQLDGMHSSVLKADGTVWVCGYEALNYARVGSGGSVALVQAAGLSRITAVACGFVLRNEALRIETDVATVNVPEGGTAAFQVRLGAAPSAAMAVTVAKSSGDVDLTVLLGASLAFTPANWNQWQTVTLAAADDADTEAGVAEFALSVAGSPFADGVPVRAFEADNDAAGGSTVWAWGDNRDGQLGDGTTTGRLAPVHSEFSGARAVAVSRSHSVALGEDGRVWTWGLNSFGQLGDGTTISRNLPSPVAGLSGVTDVAAGDTHSMALKSDGTVWLWGNNGFSSMVDSATRTAPEQIAGLSGVMAIAMGAEQFDHVVALKDDGSVWGWRPNEYGQLGNGTTTASGPVPAAGLSGITAVAAGSYFTLARKNDGSVWGWGENSYGQLGNGTTTNCLTPVPVSGLADIVAVAAGEHHALALKADGSVWAWGNNVEGELGDGTGVSRWTPVQVTGLSGVVRIAAGRGHSLAVKADGSAWAWGWNDDGELGDGTTTGRFTPAPVPGLSGVVAIAGGGCQTLAVAGAGGGGNHPPAIVSPAWADPNPAPLPAGTTAHVVAGDPDGDALTYAWSKVSGPGTATFAAPSAADSGVTFSAAGSYVLRMTVNDGRGGNVTSDVTVAVTDGYGADPRADCNGDKVVNALDLQIVIANFGKTVP